MLMVGIAAVGSFGWFNLLTAGFAIPFAFSSESESRSIIFVENNSLEVTDMCQDVCTPSRGDIRRRKVDRFNCKIDVDGIQETICRKLRLVKRVPKNRF